MVLAHGIKNWFEERRKKRLEKAMAEGRAEGEAKGHAKGRSEGREQNQQLWVAWNARRLEAEARGVEFTEPPPNGKT